jgi:hypothetical protein
LLWHMVGSLSVKHFTEQIKFLPFGEHVIVVFAPRTPTSARAFENERFHCKLQYPEHHQRGRKVLAASAGV